jgi:hypothetical protein
MTQPPIHDGCIFIWEDFNAEKKQAQKTDYPAALRNGVQPELQTEMLRLCFCGA